MKKSKSEIKHGTLHLLVLSKCPQQSLAGAKAGSWKSTQVSHMGDRDLVMCDITTVHQGLL